MNRVSYLRLIPCLALLIPAYAACGLDETSVGSDGGGGAGGNGVTGQDAGCSTTAVCNEPNIPVGCTLGAASCVDGKYICPPVVCPDAGGTGSTCTAAGGTCTGTGASPCANRASASVDDCETVPPNPGGSFCCLDSSADSGAPADASSPSQFTCGNAGLACTSSVQYCQITQGGAAYPDGGTTASNAVCETFPTKCTGNLAGLAAECACLQTTVTAATCTYDSDGNFTLTRDVP